MNPVAHVIRRTPLANNVYEYLCRVIETRAAKIGVRGHFRIACAGRMRNVELHAGTRYIDPTRTETVWSQTYETMTTRMTNIFSARLSHVRQTASDESSVCVFVFERRAELNRAADNIADRHGSQQCGKLSSTHRSDCVHPKRQHFVARLHVLLAPSAVPSAASAVMFVYCSGAQFGRRDADAVLHSQNPEWCTNCRGKLPRISYALVVM